MKRIPQVILVMALVVFSGIPAVAQDGLQPAIAPKIIGLDIGVGISPFTLMPGQETLTWFGGALAWESQGYYRNTDGSLYTGNPDSASYDRLRAQWRIGLEQQLAGPADDSIPGLRAHLIYTGSWISRFADEGSTIAVSGLPDAAQSQINSLILATSYDSVAVSADGLVDGGYIEMSAEYGPGFLNFIGEADYLRLNLTTRAYIPVWTLYSERGTNDATRLMSLTLAAFSSIDSVFGRSIPVEVIQTIGGLSPRSGLGGAVRGIRGGRFGVTNKLVANVETRLDLPALLIPGLGAVRPGLLTFLDAGTYSDEVTVPSPVDGSEVTTGTALYVDVLGIATLAFYTTYWVTGERLGEEGRLNPFSLGFGLHF